VKFNDPKINYTKIIDTKSS